MALFQASITIWALFILINGALLLGVDYGLKLCDEHAHISCGWVNKMVASGVNDTNFPNELYQNFTDPENTLVENFTNVANKTFGNHTGNDDILDPILDSTDVLLFNTQELFRVVTSVCTLCTTIDAMALSMDIDPETNVAFQGMTALIVAGMAVTNILLIVYLTSGRSI